METFGKWLEAHRKHAGLTQKELSIRAGCTRAYISLLERGIVESKTGRPIQPGRDIVDALARALGVPIPVARRAAGYAVVEEMASEVERYLMEYFRNLSPDGKSIAVVLLKALHDREIAIARIEMPELGQIIEDVSIIGQG